MRVILRPAALLIEPFSSARLLFFPLPVAAEMGQGRGGRPMTQVYPPLAFPGASPTAPDVGRPGHLTQVSRVVRPALHCMRVASPPPLPILASPPDPPQAPTVFAGLSAAKGGRVIAHAQAVGV